MFTPGIISSNKKFNVGLVLEVVAPFSGPLIPVFEVPVTVVELAVET